MFPPYDGPGFGQNATHRFYSDAALQGTISITVAEPLAHRASVAQEIQMSLGLPLLVVLPLALVAIILAVRFSLAPLHPRRTPEATLPISLPVILKPTLLSLSLALHRKRLAAVHNCELY